MKKLKQKTTPKASSPSNNHFILAIAAVVAALLIYVMMEGEGSDQTVVEKTPTPKEKPEERRTEKTIETKTSDDDDLIGIVDSEWSQEGELFAVTCLENMNDGTQSCTPSKCGSAVFDNFLSGAEVAQLNDLMDLGMSMGSGPLGPPGILDLVSGAVSEGSQFIDAKAAMRYKGITFKQEDLLLYKNVTDRIKAKIEATFDVSGLMLTQPTFFSKISGERKAKTLHDEYWHEHVDTLQYPSFVYTSLLYLNNYEEEYTGGMFIFDDKEKSTRRLVRPSSGKLSIFTSGRENVHHISSVRTGERRAITIAFTCTEEAAIQNFLGDILNVENVES